FFVPLVFKLIETFDQSLEPFVDSHTHENTAKEVQFVFDAVRLVQNNRITDAVVGEHLLVRFVSSAFSVRGIVRQEVSVDFPTPRYHLANVPADVFVSVLDMVENLRETVFINLKKH